MSIAIVPLIAGAAGTRRLTALRLPGERPRPFRDDPEHTEFPPECWCSIGKEQLNAGD
jgi:hypothetical protein